VIKSARLAMPSLRAWRYCLTMPMDHPAGQDDVTRLRFIVSVSLAADGRVTRGRMERLLDDDPNLRWKATWPDADDLLTRRAAAIEQRHHSTVVLEGGGTL
jgi:hypothetical protein